MVLLFTIIFFKVTFNHFYILQRTPQFELTSTTNIPQALLDQYNELEVSNTFIDTFVIFLKYQLIVLLVLIFYMMY